MKDLFHVAFTTPTLGARQPMSPVHLDAEYVMYCASREQQIDLVDTTGTLTTFRVVQVRHHLDPEGNHDYFNLFVLP